MLSGGAANRNGQPHRLVPGDIIKLSLAARLTGSSEWMRH